MKDFTLPILLVVVSFMAGMLISIPVIASVANEVSTPTPTSIPTSAPTKMPAVRLPAQQASEFLPSTPTTEPTPYATFVSDALAGGSLSASEEALLKHSEFMLGEYAKRSDQHNAVVSQMNAAINEGDFGKHKELAYDYAHNVVPEMTVLCNDLASFGFVSYRLEPLQEFDRILSENCKNTVGKNGLIALGWRQTKTLKRYYKPLDLNLEPGYDLIEALEMNND